MPNYTNDDVVSTTDQASNGAVVGVSENHTQQAGPGVYGKSDGVGVWGHSRTWMGVYGYTTSTTGGAGVMGESLTGLGVRAVSKDGPGLGAYSNSNEAIHAETQSTGSAAIAAFNLNEAGTGAAIYGRKAGTSGHAGFFEGNVHVTGKLTAVGNIELVNADCAEDFDVEAAIDAGSVMVLSASGALSECTTAYDKRVVGVVSGAGRYRPGLVLDRTDARSNRRPIALLGKVYCKVDAQAAAVEVGDLLTTSETPGHAMKANDASRAFGAVIGKAMAPLREGRGLVPIVIALQ